MKIKILAVLAVVTVVIVSMFMREKREDPSSLVMMNVEALATGEGTSPAMCVDWFGALSGSKLLRTLYKIESRSQVA